MTAGANQASIVPVAEIARIDLRTSRSGDTATGSLQRALGLQFRYQPARLAIARSIALPGDPPAVENFDGKAIRGETLFGAAPEEFGFWMGLLCTRDPSARNSRRTFQEMVAAHWARGAGLLWDSLRDEREAPLALATQLLKGRS